MAIVRVGTSEPLWLAGNSRRRPQDAIGLDGYDVVIWSDEHHAYFRSEALGYTTELDQAGVFEFGDAYARTKHTGAEKKIWFYRVKHVENLIDDTFTAIVLRAPIADRGPRMQWLYFRHDDHGGPVEDVLFADRFSIDPGLRYAEERAKTRGSFTWERARLIVKVEPFSDEAELRAIDVNIDSQLRGRALAKLDADERRVLGL